MKRTVVVATLVALASLAFAPAAFASVPAANDLWPGTTVASLPFSETIDTSAATTDANDTEANVADCGAPATDASVWYQYTPATDEIVIAETLGSSYSSGVIVVTGAPGNFTFVACQEWSVAFFAQGGTTYSLVAVDDQLDGDGLNGGDLTINIYNAPPPPTLDLSVRPTGTFNRDGTATVSGTVTCTGVADFGFVDVSLSQRVGRINIVGENGTDIACDGQTHTWSVTVAGYNGLFKGGKAATVAVAFACGFDCSEAIVQTTIMLRK